MNGMMYLSIVGIFVFLLGIIFFFPKKEKREYTQHYEFQHGDPDVNQKIFEAKQEAIIEEVIEEKKIEQINKDEKWGKNWLRTIKEYDDVQEAKHRRAMDRIPRAPIKGYTTNVLLDDVHKQKVASYLQNQDKVLSSFKKND